MSKGTKISIAVIITLILVLGGLVGAGLHIISGNTIKSNIYINGIDVSGLTMQAAEKKIKDTVDSHLSNAVIDLKFEEKTWPLSLKDMDFSYNYTNAISQAYAIGNEGGFFKRISDVLSSRSTKHDISMNFSYNQKYVNTLLQKVSQDIDQEAVDATIKLGGSGFVLTDEKIGRKMDQKKAYDMIIQQVDRIEAGIIQLPIAITEPTIKRADLANIQDKLGEYSTKFNAADVDRSNNIRLAAKSASNVLIKPGEVFSLNKTVGPRLAKFGYKEAKVIINNELVPGIGGGVCQVSSTLYNAALLSNMKIVERKNHSLPSSYVPLGRDATISGDYLDFKFKNSTPYPIYIYGEVKGNWVKFSIFGKNDNPNRKAKIRTEIIKKTDPQISIIEDPTLPEGTTIEEKKAFTGYVVKSYRDILENGKVIFTEPLYTDTYRVANGVKRVGTKKITAPLDGEPEAPVNVQPGTNTDTPPTTGANQTTPQSTPQSTPQ